MGYDVMNIKKNNLIQIDTGRPIYILDESRQRFGTYKDRRSRYIANILDKIPYNHIMMITAGNAGYSLKKICNSRDVTFHFLVDFRMEERLKTLLKGDNCHVVEVDLHKEILVEEDCKAIFRLDKEALVLDVSNGMHDAYASIVDDIYSYKPDYIVVPLGSGEAYYGIAMAVENRKLATRVIGIRPKQMIGSVADKLCAIWTPYSKHFVNLINKGHLIIELDENAICRCYHEFKHYVECEHSSAVVAGALQTLSFGEQDKIILINSGKLRKEM